MVSAAILFQPGWTYEGPATATMEDPVTGETIIAPGAPVVGRGLVQAPLWTGVSENTVTSIVDERLVMFEPTGEMPADFEITSDGDFYSPEGKCWQAITDGMTRSIPGHPPEYYAARVRRAKEKDR